MEEIKALEVSDGNFCFLVPFIENKKKADRIRNHVAAFLLDNGYKDVNPYWFDIKTDEGWCTKFCFVSKDATPEFGEVIKGALIEAGSSLLR